MIIEKNLVYAREYAFAFIEAMADRDHTSGNEERDTHGGGDSSRDVSDDAHNGVEVDPHEDLQNQQPAFRHISYI